MPRKTTGQAWSSPGSTRPASLPWVVRPQLREDDGQAMKLILPNHLDQLRRIIQQTGSGLLILDPFYQPHVPHVRRSHRTASRSYLEPLADVCWECQCTCLLLRHLRKGTGGDAGVNRASGKRGSANMARAVLRCDGHPHELERFVLSCV